LVQGQGAPREVHPLKLYLANKSRTNYAQMVPYRSKECFLFQEEYDNLCNCLDQVFEWLQKKLECCLPGLVLEIRGFAEELPGQERSPSYPFSGFVLNLNACTKVHRDAKDLHACLVMAFGKYWGGELGLVEPGLLVDLQAGDMVVFQSQKVSHFNLLY
ncbi:hypothetical protein K466DRAFT_465040, partial [Polyporus arcularius HHB13444]